MVEDARIGLLVASGLFVVLEHLVSFLALWSLGNALLFVSGTGCLIAWLE